uniref:Uncharacterized protein isoform X2 n=2 Tax=Nicotiana TaxID=4085 RepID=A0A1S3X3S8_TOBAC|nr:PREDICTED: uncharacterized protein LOC107760766 isoform X2 [Nicotiana tabacum]
MKPSKNENEVTTTVKATAKYAFVASGAIDKGRGRGLKSICSLGVSGPDIPFSPSTDQVMQYKQSVETSALAKGRGRGLRSMCSLGVFGMGPTNKNLLVLEKWHMQTNISSFSSTADVMKYIQKNSMSSLEKGQGQELRSMCSLEECENEERSFHQNTHYTSQSISRPSNSRRSNFTMPFVQGLRTTNKNLLVHEKEHMQSDIPISPSDEQVMQFTQKVETSTLGKGQGRELRSMCSFEESENEEQSFHQNAHYASQSMSRPSKSTRLDSTVFAAQGLRTKNINSLDKFESDDMDIHRNHILGWMKELWNKWRGQLHAKYVKGKPIQEALKNVPKGVDKKQWEWLVKEHFATESFQARSNRNAANKTKLKMLHHIGSKPIREIIYQKAQIKELVQSEPSLPTIEIVEQCFDLKVVVMYLAWGVE